MNLSDKALSSPRNSSSAFGGAIRSIRTESLMTEPISAYYEDCALGGCTVCNQLALPHYNLSAAGTYWWTGTLPRR